MLEITAQSPLQILGHSSAQMIISMNNTSVCVGLYMVMKCKSTVDLSELHWSKDFLEDTDCFHGLASSEAAVVTEHGRTAG